MWLETITLRTSASLRHELERELIDTVLADPEIAQEAVSVVVYLRASSSTDLSVHLNHTERDPGAGSPCGCRLAETLRTHGIVDHAVWQSIAHDARAD